MDSAIIFGSEINFLRYSGIAFVAWFLYELWIHRDGSALGCHRRTDLECPPGIPILGNLLTMLVQGEKQLEYWTTLRQNHQDKTKALSISVPGMRMIDGTSPEAIEHVQKNNFKNYAKGPIIASIFNQILGEGIFAVDGEKWLTIRKATSKIFSAANFRGVISTAIDDDLKKLEIILDRHAASGEEFDLAALFFGFTLSSFTTMAFTVDVGSLSLDSNAAPVPFAEAFDYAQGGMSRRLFNPFWKFTELFSEDGRKMRAAAKTLDDFAYGIIAQREADGLHTVVGKGDGRNKEGKMDLLSLYMQLRDDHGKPMSRSALRDAVLNLIIAGRDTTAQGLSWIFYHLMSNPALVETLRQDVDAVPVVDYDNFKSMNEVMAVFNEGLRLHPSVPKNQWVAKEDDVLPNGTVIKAGEYVRWGDWEMGRSTALWGPDAQEFKPSRWITDDGGLMKIDMWKSHWFNGGPRLCLGQNLAQYEASAVIATIVRKFDVKFAPTYLATTEMVEITGETTPRYQNSLTLPMNAPLRVTVSRRVV